MRSTVPVFDGHNDFVSRRHAERSVDFVSGDGTNHISLDAMRRGGLIGGFFAMFVPPQELSHDRYAFPPRLRLDRARRVALEQFQVLLETVEGSQGALRTVKTGSEIAALEREVNSAAVAPNAAGRLATAKGDTMDHRSVAPLPIAVVPHLEGCEAISSSFAELDVMYAAGLRSIGIVWSRHNRFGHGVPIVGEGSPDTAPGLTALGRELVRRARRLGMVVDLSHLTERGFWDVAALDDAPLVASHSNAWELCHSPRNLTDRQLDAIGRSDGIVGLNFGTIFLRRDGKPDETTPISTMVEHIRYLVDRAGIDHVALGSDFDGAPIPSAIGDAGGTQRLIEALGAAGFTPAEVEKIAWRNWVRLLTRVLG